MSDRFTANKLAWIEQITRDPKLGHLAARVGVIIASHLNRETGEAFPGQERIASLTGASTRQVQRALKELAGRAHVAVEVRHGPNQSSRYRPLIWTENTTPVSSIRGDKTRRPCRLSDVEKATNTVTKTRHPCRPNPLKEPSDSPNPKKAVCVSATHTEAFQDEDVALAFVRDLITKANVEANPRTVLLACQSHHGDGWRAKLKTWTLGAIARSAEKPKPISPAYDGPAELRSDALKVGGDRLAGYFDHYCRWREDDRTLMCRNSVIADTIVRAMGETWLDSREISIGIMAANDAKPIAARRTGRVGWV